jgi:hypothetical protein
MGKGGITIMVKRLPSIRISEKDRLEYNKLVSKAKRKIRDVNKKYGVDLTGEVEFKKIGEFNTRQEYNEWKEKQQSFTNRNNLKYQFVKNQYGTVASKAEINKIQRDVKRAQNLADQANKALVNKPRIAYGGQVAGTLGQKMLQMKRPNAGGIYRPKDFDFKDIRSRTRLEEIEKNIEKRANPKYRDERTERMRDRYIEKLQNTFNSDADRLVELIMLMDVDEFYDMYQMVDEFDFNEIYIEEMLSELGMQTGDLTERLEDYVKRYMRGDFPSLKDF